MRDRGDHYLGNNAWASSGDGVAADNWELAGGRPRPSASPAANPIPTKAPPPTPRLLGSVKVNKPVTTSPKRTAPQAAIGSAPSITASSPSSIPNSKHRVFQCLQQDKLLMGAEMELARLNISVTMLLGLAAVMFMNWHLALVAVLFGGPVQWALRVYADHDPDYFKAFIEGFRCPHLREPE
jgi:type IV secretory pathway TrbD component